MCRVFVQICLCVCGISTGSLGGGGSYKWGVAVFGRVYGAAGVEPECAVVWHIDQKARAGGLLRV